MAVNAGAQISTINVGSSPDATDGDTIRNAFIKCNNNFTLLGAQLSGVNDALSGLSTSCDPYGMALTVGFYCTNYVRYVVGTNVVGWLGCLNAESNVLQSDITALTNNVNSLWSVLGGSTILHSGGVMQFDRAAAYPYPMQIYSDGSGNLTVNGSLHAGYLSDSYSSTPAAGYVATSQGTDGTWQWQALPAFPTTLNFDSGNITSDGSGNAFFVGIQAQQLKDSGGGTGNNGDYAKANGSGGWNWTAWPAALNYDSGAITSDGNGDMTATSVKAGFTDNNGSSGNSGYLPVANGNGGWTWTQGDVVLDSGGNGGTCLQLKASDNGTTMYLHVDSAGNITVTGNP
jgi:hypothetical protein